MIKYILLLSKITWWLWNVNWCTDFRIYTTCPSFPCVRLSQSCFWPHDRHVQSADCPLHPWIRQEMKHIQRHRVWCYQPHKAGKLPTELNAQLRAIQCMAWELYGYPTRTNLVRVCPHNVTHLATDSTTVHSKNSSIHRRKTHLINQIILFVLRRQVLITFCQHNRRILSCD
jgi:hypothetical protein